VDAGAPAIGGIPSNGIERRRSGPREIEEVME